MAADEQRREGHGHGHLLDPAELKNLRTIVLDLEELRQLRRIARRPGVRSLLHHEIGSLESKIVSSCTDSDEKDLEKKDGNANLFETSMKRKHKGRGQPESSVMTKKLKLAATGKPLLVHGSSCKDMEEEPHQQEPRTSQQVLPEKANLFVVNEASPTEDLSTKHADISDKISQIRPSVAVIPASGSRHGSSKKRSWCHICQVPNPAEPVCCRLNGSCFKCHEMEHIKKNCYKVFRDANSPSAMRQVTAGSSCESTQEEPDQQTLPTRTSEQV